MLRLDGVEGSGLAPNDGTTHHHILECCNGNYQYSCDSGDGTYYDDYALGIECSAVGGSSTGGQCIWIYCQISEKMQLQEGMIALELGEFESIEC